MSLLASIRRDDHRYYTKQLRGLLDDTERLRDRARALERDLADAPAANTHYLVRSASEALQAARLDLRRALRELPEA